MKELKPYAGKTDILTLTLSIQQTIDISITEFHSRLTPKCIKNQCSSNLLLTNLHILFRSPTYMISRVKTISFPSITTFHYFLNSYYNYDYNYQSYNCCDFYAWSGLFNQFRAKTIRSWANGVTGVNHPSQVSPKEGSNPHPWEIQRQRQRS